MSDGTDEVVVHKVLRCHRVEVIDPEGRLRAVLGPLPTPQLGAPVFGLALHDDMGKPRVWLAVDRNGPAQVFDLAGNNLITLGVNDRTDDALHVGAYCHVTDLDGTPVFGWQVDEDGSVLQRNGGATR